jgi:uncharacterized membrane-anchored protein
MNDATVGLIGGIAGTIVGCLGGIIGTYFSIKKTNGPRERAFMIKFCAATWAALLVFLTWLLFLPTPYKYLAWIPYSIGLPMGIRYCNRRQQEIRQSESNQ